MAQPKERKLCSSFSRSEDTICLKFYGLAITDWLSVQCFSPTLVNTCYSPLLARLAQGPVCLMIKSAKTWKNAAHSSQPVNAQLSLLLISQTLPALTLSWADSPIHLIQSQNSGNIHVRINVSRINYYYYAQSPLYFKITHFHSKWFKEEFLFIERVKISRV